MKATRHFPHNTIANPLAEDLFSRIDPAASFSKVTAPNNVASVSSEQIVLTQRLELLADNFGTLGHHYDALSRHLQKPIIKEAFTDLQSALEKIVEELNGNGRYKNYYLGRAIDQAKMKVGALSGLTFHLGFEPVRRPEATRAMNSKFLEFKSVLMLACNTKEITLRINHLLSACQRGLEIIERLGGAELIPKIVNSSNTVSVPNSSDVKLESSSIQLRHMTSQQMNGSPHVRVSPPNLNVRGSGNSSITNEPINELQPSTQDRASDTNSLNGVAMLRFNSDGNPIYRLRSPRVSSYPRLPEQLPDLHLLRPK